MNRTGPLARTSRIAACVVSAALLLCSAREARANGRFPESNQLFFSPKDPQHLVLRTTFGLLDSKDRGETWRWICDSAMNVTGVEDPMVAITPTGTMFATTFGGLAITRNGACDFTYAGGDLAERLFLDLAADPSDPRRVVFFSSSYDGQDADGGIFFETKMWETTDEGQTFVPLPDLDPALLGYTLDVTKTDPERLYISAVSSPGLNPLGYLLTSRDHGKTWSRINVPFEGTEIALYIAGVDPNDADRVYLRTWSNSPDQPTRLLLSEDGAKTVRTVFNAKRALPGFSITGDGSKVYVGGPADGIQVASTKDHVFQQTSNIEVGCLAAADDGLWACSNEKYGFIVALSKDDGKTFDKRTKFCDIEGPLACAEGTKTKHECERAWPTQASFLGCGPQVGDGGLDGGARDGGTNATPLEPGGGCDCTTSRGGAAGGFGAAAIAIVALAGRLRRRRN